MRGLRPIFAPFISLKDRENILLPLLWHITDDSRVYFYVLYSDVYIYTCICMYVCMYVRTFEMYVCLYVRIYVCTLAMRACMYENLYLSVNVCIMYVCVHVLMYVCMYVRQPRTCQIRSGDV